MHALAGIAPDLAHLAQEDTLHARCALFVRLLHAPDAITLLARMCAADDVPPATRSLLATIDREALHAEQAARRRGLRHQLHRAVPALARLLPDNAIEGLLARFVVAEEFWTPAGRGLAESFCWFVANEPEWHGTFVGEVLRAYGVVAGLGAAPERPSPWTRLVAGPRGCEGFVASRPLVAVVKQLDEGAAFDDVEVPLAHATLVIAALRMQGKVTLAEGTV